MKTLLFGGLRVKDSRKTQFARCTWKFSNADEIRPQAACSAEKVTCPSQWAEASSGESPKSKSRFYRTIHLEVMPDSNAGLDRICETAKSLESGAKRTRQARAQNITDDPQRTCELVVSSRQGFKKTLGSCTALRQAEGR